MASWEGDRGHLVSWYDTQQLKPMHPRYISTVDSGNLAGHLMTLEPGLLAIPDEPIVNPRLFQGIADTFDVLCETGADSRHRSEEHTSELQSLMRTSYAVFCLKKKTK